MLKHVLMSIVKLSVFMLLWIGCVDAYAEYYLVYSAPAPCCVKTYTYRVRHHKPRVHHVTHRRHHRYRYHHCYAAPTYIVYTAHSNPSAIYYDDDVGRVFCK
jgi:hypothetical protein